MFEIFKAVEVQKVIAYPDDFPQKKKKTTTLISKAVDHCFHPLFIPQVVYEKLSTKGAHEVPKISLLVVAPNLVACLKSKSIDFNCELY